MTLTAAEMLAELRRMTSNLPDRPDRRSQSELDHEAALEQQAEDRKAARMGAFDGEASQEELARRRAG